MRRIFFFFFFIIAFFQSNGQENSLFNIEIGWPFFTKNENDFHYQLKVIGYPYISAEKPFLFKIKGIKRIGIKPGIGFWGFSEDKTSGGLGGSATHNLKHVSFHGYIKLSAQEIFSKRTKNFFNLGAISGLHLFTRTKGDASCFSIQSDLCNSTTEINKSGNDFFNSVYYGFFAGLQPKISTQHQHLIRPTFEVYYYPNFIKPSYESESIIKISVLLCIHPKQKEPLK